MTFMIQKSHIEYMNMRRLYSFTRYNGGYMFVIGGVLYD